MATNPNHDDAQAIKAGDMVQLASEKIMAHVDSFQAEAETLVTSRGLEGDGAVKFRQVTQDMREIYARQLIRRMENAIGLLSKTDEVFVNTNETITAAAGKITATINYK